MTNRQSRFQEIFMRELAANWLYAIEQPGEPPGKNLFAYDVMATAASNAYEELEKKETEEDTCKYSDPPDDACSTHDSRNCGGEPKRWRAELGEKHYYITNTMRVGMDIEQSNEYSSALWETMNYFKDKESALKALESIKTLLKNIHQ